MPFKSEFNYLQYSLCLLSFYSLKKKKVVSNFTMQYTFEHYITHFYVTGSWDKTMFPLLSKCIWGTTGIKKYIYIYVHIKAVDICLWGKKLEKGRRWETLQKVSSPWRSPQMVRRGQWVRSSVRRFISHKLPGEGLAEPHEAYVRATPQKGRRKQEIQKCTTGCEMHTHKPL